MRVRARARRRETTRPGLWIALEWTNIAIALALLTITETYQTYIPLAVMFLIIVTGARLRRSGRLFPSTGLEIPGVVFILSAALATWIAYNRGLAFLQFSRFLAAGVLFASVVDGPPRVREWVAHGLVLAAAALAVYWPVQHDFSANGSKFAWLAGVGEWINAHVSPLPGPTVHPNVAAGTLALVLPLAAVLAWRALRSGKGVQAAVLGLLTVVILASLVLTGSRGAWIALAAACGLAALGAIQWRWFRRRGRAAYWVVVTVLLVGAVGWLIASGTSESVLGKLPDPTGTLQQRSLFWQQGIPLTRDYAFTGSGLMTFPMVFSNYAIFIHVPYLDHMHNLYLEIGIEQGITGLLALLMIFVAVVRWGWLILGQGEFPWLAAGGMLGLVVVAVHGLFDVVFTVERTLPLLGLVLGLVATGALRSEDVEGQREQLFQRWQMAYFALAAALAIGGAVVYKPLLAVFYANLGAVEQTQLELTAYDPKFFYKYTMDDIRRSIDLGGTEANFQRALDNDPQNETALQRLLEITLSRGEYERARGLAGSLMQNRRDDFVSRSLIGDVLVADLDGDLELAANMVRDVPWAQFRLAGEAWYRYFAAKPPDYTRAARAWSVILLLEPGNPDATYWRNQALKLAR